MTMRPEKLLPSQQTLWAVLKKHTVIKSLLLRVSCGRLYQEDPPTIGEQPKPTRPSIGPRTIPRRPARSPTTLEPLDSTELPGRGSTD